jgi:hypothetical protein
VKRRRGSNRQRLIQDELLGKLLGLLLRYRGVVRVTILRNIALVSHALVTVFGGARGSNGWLSKAAVARCLPLEIGAKGREQRLYRLLGNPRFTPEVMIPLMVAVACGAVGGERIPMILDQSTIRGIQTLLVGLVFEGRVLPVGFSCFTYEMIQKSQNVLEHSLIMLVMSCFAVKQRPVLILDRGYARVDLLRRLKGWGVPFIVRAARNVVVVIGGKRLSLGRMGIRPGQLRRHRILYHGQKKEPMELVAFWGKGHQEPWYLLVPEGADLTAEQIVGLYAKRMSIEQGFRDWKTHLGVRGLVFVGEDPAPRLTRLLMAFALSYLLCLALGATPEGQAVRAFVEIPRRTARHGTCRTLSVLSVGILRLSLRRFAERALRDLLKILDHLSTGKGLIAYCSSKA